MSRRVLMIASSLPRWAGDSTTSFVLDLASDIQREGWTIRILAPHAPGAARSETIEGVSIRRFRYLWPDRLQTVCYQGGALINLRQSRSNWAKLPALLVAELAATASELRHGHYALVHAHWTVPQGLIAALAAPPRRTPWLLTAHGGDLLALDGPLITPFKRYAIKRADAVTVNSSVTEDAVLDLGGALDRVHRIPMGVDVAAPAQRDVERFRQRWPAAGAGPVVIFAGRIVEEKGVFDAVDAIDRLRREEPHARLVVAGDGQERDRLHRLVRQRRLDGVVDFIGWVPRSDVAALLAAGDVVVVPSQRAPDGWVEAQGLVVLEAMAAGTPVVATRLGGVVDTVVHETTGLLVRERQPEELAAACKRIWRDELLATTLVEGGRKVAAEFERSRVASRFAALYDTVAGLDPSKTQPRS